MLMQNAHQLYAWAAILQDVTSDDQQLIIEKKLQFGKHLYNHVNLCRFKT